MSTYKQIFKNNKKWIAEHKASNKDFFKNLAKGQSPDYLYIGCSDSRVTAEDMMGLKPGELFVHRNVANVVGNTDLNAISVIEYAVGHLKVKHIVVCGHYGCGGVKAAMQPSDLGILNPYLSNIRDVYRLHKRELNAIKNEGKRYKRLVELNVQEQCLNILKLPVVQKAYYNDKSVQIHGWVFDIKTGRLIDMKLDFSKILRGVKSIYDLGV